ncbi:FtsW/RodA/SpoVE family cell cycle protein [Zhihengliuella halotolerans]|uniref:Cell elongation-specific peptidoglycan biosynthesis regulator RodA n=1 Tax=Zhihengliuella halotolerans TaxID=370736 RepID=A0A4Q8AG04_9MICC|nr:FtsW/RodA/SpoVE family cell cycle protein [Zhihengliuella halotolerans]RZU63184.1 cell elongation-specific peptidoglycan biosynthesis regulator RodA [Zhihengliuella halotolerans]
MSELRTAPISRRNTELWLLVLAMLVAVGAGYLAGLSNPEGLSPEFAKQGAILCALALGMHIVLRIWAKYADPIILPCVVALNGIGVAMIHRLDITTGDTAATRQLMWTGVAIAAAMAVIWAIRDHRILRRAVYICLVVSAVLMVLPLIPGLGQPVNGARIWIFIGGMSFQPGELAKITLSIFFAGYLSSNRDLILLAGRKIGPLQLPRVRDMAPMVLAWIISIGVLILQRDLGSAILFFGLFMAMIYVATARISWILIGLGLVAVGGVFAVQFMGHVERRINAWINAFDPEVINAQFGSHQIVQGMFGLANGGLFGTGFGNGRPDLVPYANSDMIITAIGEELGLIGVIAVVLLYVLLVSRGIRAALGTRDAFGKLLASGLSFTIGLQCFVVIGGVTRLIPLTGLTTPFVAAGGSSLLANWIIIALLLLVSNNARKPVPSADLTNEVVLKKGANA